MRNYKSSEIRNVGLVAHGSCGKTSLSEAMLYNSGLTSRLGKVDDGTTTTDYLPEEIKRKVTISSSLASLFWQDHKLNIIDTPGYSDFIGEVLSSLRAVDSTVMLICGVSGIEVQTETIWEHTQEIPKSIFINKLDRENADFFRVVEQLQNRFGLGAMPLQLPLGEEKDFYGIVDLLTQKAFEFSNGQQQEIPIPDTLLDKVEVLRNHLIEVCVEHDDELLLAYLEGESISEKELASALKKGIAEGKIFPILAGSAYNNIGVINLMNHIVEFHPSPIHSKLWERNHSNGPSAFVYKTLADPFVGKLNFLRILTGQFSTDEPLYNLSLDKEEKNNIFLSVCGKQQTPISVAVAGDIIAIPKLQETQTGHTITNKKNSLLPLESPINLPLPNLTLAITPKTRGDEDKVGTALSRLLEEDPTLQVEKNPETKETLIKGLGDLQLEILCEKCKTKFGVDILLSEPKIPYRETITNEVRVQGKHKKQSGGAGQYGDVWLKLEPIPNEHFQFATDIFGGAVPKNYFPAVEKGVREAMSEGHLAGYPMTNIKVTLCDGSYHPVDSNEMAFKLAGSLAFKKGVEKAKPVLLEPMMNLEILAPESFMGDIMSDITSKRGQITGIEPNENKQCVYAQAPLAELQRYAIDLKSLTQGRGTFTMKLSHYEKVPTKQSEIILSMKKS